MSRSMPLELGSVAIIFTGRMPEGLRNFSTFYLRWRVRAVAVGVLRWRTNVEAYLLLRHDEYPPFSLSAQ
jgi:hypothetical protein